MTSYYQLAIIRLNVFDNSNWAADKLVDEENDRVCFLAEVIMTLILYNLRILKSQKSYAVKLKQFFIVIS